MTYPVQIADGTPPNPFRTGLEEIKFRERLIEGLWYTDLWSELIRQLGADRANLVGTPDMSRNPALRLSSRLSVVYSPTPLVTDMPPELTEALGDWSGPVTSKKYAEAGGSPMPTKLSEIQSRALLYALICNESAVMFPWASVAGRVVPQVAKPSVLRGLEDPQNPGQPSALGWMRPRKVGDDTCDTWEIWDLRGTPTYYISDVWGIEDDEAFFVEAPNHVVLPKEARKGSAYTWRDMDGNPIIPGSVLHSHPHAGLWDRSSGSELTQATVTLGVHLTHWGHLLKDGSWIRPFVLGAQLVSGQQTPATIKDALTKKALAPNSVPNDLSSLLEFEADPKAKQVQVGQLSPSGDPKLTLEAILAWEQALWGQILSIDVSSTGGDPLARIDAAIEARIRTLYPACREHDWRSLLYAAIVARRFGGRKIPEFSPGIMYREEIAAMQPKPEPVKPAPRPAEPVEDDPETEVPETVEPEADDLEPETTNA
jgi:hypothetical protein